VFLGSGCILGAFAFFGGSACAPTQTQGHMSADEFDSAQVIAGIPHLPGVYLMKDKRDRVVYVGKAKDLKARVRSYFSGADTRPFVAHLGELLSNIEVMLTENEKEAVILENTLIKEHRPRFNFMLRDDKEFLQLRIDPDGEWPRVQIVRRRRKDGAQYFGPYHSALACRETLRVLNRHFTLRTCRDSVLHNRDRPCLQYQIKRCPGPCVFDVDRAVYAENVKSAMLFLRGRQGELVEGLKAKMLAASEGLEFEYAALLRDQLRAVEKVLVRQEVVLESDVDQDAFGIHREGGRVTVQLLFIRGGRLLGGDTVHFKDQLGEDAEILSQLFMSHYGDGAFVPAELLCPVEVEAAETLAELLSEARGRRVKVVVPQRGPRRKLVESAQRNAEHQFTHHTAEADTDAILQGLRERLDLSRIPRRIECYDISNLQAGAIVASMVVFTDGKPTKSEYRTFKMRDLTSQDDFGALYEVITRRFRWLAEQDYEPGDAENPLAKKKPVSTKVPDLVLIDGGKGQLSAALDALDDLGVSGQFDLRSIAKSRTLDAHHEGQKDVEHSPERLFRPGDAEPTVLPSNSDEMFLLQQLRDEAHRVAIGLHRKVRGKQSLRSKLDAIPGVGPKRKAALLKVLGTLDKIREATLEELLAVPGMNRAAAVRLLEALGRSSG